MSRLLVLAAACGTATPASAPVASHVEPPQVKRACVAAAADAGKRSQLGVQLAKPYTPVDFDGDGAPDDIYVTTEIGGNRDAYLYASNHGCAEFIGSVTTSFLDLPSCEEPAQPGAICTIVSTRYMIHGDTYEYHYRCEHGACAESGRARQLSPPPSKVP